MKKVSAVNLDIGKSVLTPGLNYNNEYVILNLINKQILLKKKKFLSFLKLPIKTLILHSVLKFLHIHKDIQPFESIFGRNYLEKKKRKCIWCQNV